MSRRLTRRRALATLGLGAPALLLGCDRLGRAPSFRDMVLETGEWLSYRAQRLVAGQALAREYAPSDMSPVFRTNGSTRPRDPDYLAHAETGFADWRLAVDGRVARPGTFSLSDLRDMPARTQITRHDCVEGWSAIGQWTGVPLWHLLQQTGIRAEARYIVFHCADDYSGRPYYESIDLADAAHPQTILAYAMNEAALPMGHGAPLRLRVERQLGYKHAKFVMRIEAVATLAETGLGKGGFWEDRGFYEWYAGI
ncbi:molybdopterin-binding protein [Mesobaculum littorinae]|uniref:Molybdopterin-binding protein n=1 Tax=Mesobaculum littorinae TaxID=2486419 RepID=A0A438AJD7_9RHOB|nr:molybdopterin-dependent oxidoreductase [Mesobaculum littorinae]RVV98820.1 molybdopterin-binding protein [Mesobaculum littorinae]